MDGLPLGWRRATLMIWDAVAWLTAMFFTIGLRYDLALSESHWFWAFVYTIGAIAIHTGLGLLTQFYLGRHQIGSFSEVTLMGVIVLISGVPLAFILDAFVTDFPRGLGVALPPLTLLFMGASRWLVRLARASTLTRTSSDAKRALVYGAGDAGHQVARLVERAEDAPYTVVGFLDDDPSKRYLRLGHTRVMGTGKHLVKVAKETEADVVILAVSSASPELLNRVSKLCDAQGLELVVIPSVQEMIGGRMTLGSLRQFNVADLLGRRPIKTDLHAIADYINGHTVLVTGAGGSIGAELALQVHRLGPRKLILLDRDESQLHTAQLTIYGNGLLDTDDVVLCDIREPDALNEIFEKHRPEVVFHAAALKHLPVLERFPKEGWKTNVLGTLNVLRAAHSVGVQHLVNISTDKAADASSVLGRTKRVAERLTAWYAQQYGVKYLSVRFGNVLGSRGSVLHSFRHQIEHGGPITVTHPEVTRFFMTIPEACELVLQAGAIGRPGEVMVLDMGKPIKIVDVAERLIAESKEDIEIRFTGLRPGEKMHEVLFSPREAGAPSEHPLISAVPVPPLAPESLPDHPQESEVVSNLLEDLDTAKLDLHNTENPATVIL